MSDILNIHIESLDSMKQYPKRLYYRGDTALLDKRKISIVGTRKPTPYTKQMTYELAKRLSHHDICVVSGAAIGVDGIAHQAAGANNTIAVVANGLDIHYPKTNRKIIESIEKEGLMISPFKDGYEARPYSFVQRNEIVVALGEALIITQADLKSGSLHSANFALNQNRPIYVLAQRVNESLGTQALIKENKAEVIHDIDEFIHIFTQTKIQPLEDEFLNFCAKNPTYEEALKMNSQKVFEYELLGKIFIENGFVRLR